MITINIMDKVGNEDFWAPEGTRQEYSHHMYRNSPYESCDSCGNCNGANCDRCELLTIPGHLEFSVHTDSLYAWLLEKDVPEDVAGFLAYNDSCRKSYKDYYLAWPTEDMLKEQYPELYATITTPDKEILAVINSYKGQFKVYGDLRDAVQKHLNLPKYTYHGHIVNQLEMYWMSCSYDHKVACN